LWRLVCIFQFWYATHIKIWQLWWKLLTRRKNEFLKLDLGEKSSSPVLERHHSNDYQGCQM
jgi:hypothetical protein